MSDEGQSTRGLRTGFQAIASWFGLPRANGRERGEDLLADPLPESIQFTSLSPITNPHQSGKLYSLLTDLWLRRHCDPYLYERAGKLVNNLAVVLASVSIDRLSGKVCDDEVFSVEIWFEHGGVSGSCGCDSFRRHRDTSTSVDQRLACEHIVALAHYVISSNLVPETRPGDQVALCPITRQPLDPLRAIYRCERCQLSFSEEGWQFLKKMDRGRCCGCQGRNCILALPSGQEDARAGAIT